MLTSLSQLLGASHLCLTVNSSVNFLIYYSVGSKFKAASHRSGGSLPLVVL